MFNLLTDVLPQSVVVDGREYPIRWTFQHVVKVELALHAPELDENERWLAALLLFYDGEVPDDLQQAVAQMCAFLINNKPKNKAQKSAAKRQKEAPALFSFEHDDDYIFAAFMQHYGINLARVNDMHWFEFRALLHAMDDCPFTQIKSWRGTDLSKFKGKERQWYQELKTYWQIPPPETVQAVEDEIEALLMEGGDLSAFIDGRRDDG